MPSMAERAEYDASGECPNQSGLGNTAGDDEPELHDAV